MVPPGCAVPLSSASHPKEESKSVQKKPRPVDGPSSCRKSKVKAWPSCSGATTPEPGELAHTTILYKFCKVTQQRMVCSTKLALQHCGWAHLPKVYARGTGGRNEVSPKSKEAGTTSLTVP